MAKHNFLPGMLGTDRKTYLHIYCKSGYIKILELQLAGKRRMNPEQLLRGFQMNEEWKVV